MRLGHVYNAKVSIGNTQSSKVSKAATKFQPPASRQQPANKSDMCEKNRKIEFICSRQPAMAHGMASFRWICDSFIQIYFTLSLIHSSFSLSPMIHSLTPLCSPPLMKHSIKNLSLLIHYDRRSTGPTKNLSTAAPHVY